MKRCAACALWRETGGECRATVPSADTLPASVDYALIGPKRRMTPEEGAACVRFEARETGERITR